MLEEARGRLLKLDARNRLEKVLDSYRARRIRDACFGPSSDVFGEPGWDIALDLYSALMEGKSISVTSACLASCAPASTAIRHLGFMERRGLILRAPDPRDRRRAHVSLSDPAIRMMDDWLSRTEAEQPVGDTG